MKITIVSIFFCIFACANVSANERPPSPEDLIRTIVEEGGWVVNFLKEPWIENILKELVMGKCVICMDRQPNRIIIPCGHICYCEQCAELAARDHSATCPLCRKDVFLINPVYYPGTY